MHIKGHSNTDEEQGNKEALADGRQLGIKGSALTKDERKQRTGQKGTQDGFKPCLLYTSSTTRCSLCARTNCGI